LQHGGDRNLRDLTEIDAVVARLQIPVTRSGKKCARRFAAREGQGFESLRLIECKLNPGVGANRRPVGALADEDKAMTALHL
jgi:hypothetical protein